MRGLPGSGKSTLAKQVAGKDGLILSTDDFWTQDGEYKFDASKAGEAHKWNQKRALEAMKAGVPHIIIDNTNCSAYEPKYYVQQALNHGYDIDFQQSNTPWAFDIDELEKRNTHNVPRTALEYMLQNWDENTDIDHILNAVAPWEKGNQEEK